MHDINKRIIYIRCFFIFCFLSIGIYILYFNFFQAKYIYSNSYNKRLRKEDTNIIRGSIIDRNNQILVESKIYKENVNRIYKYGKHFSHIIGYSTKSIGSTGIEALYNTELNTTGTVETIKSKAAGNRIKGNTVKLTIDKELQVYSSELFKNKKGAIVALNPKTGEVLAMVSKPDYSPSNIAKNWGILIKDNNSPLLNRAVDGLYPPGSIFKVIVTTAAFRSNITNYEIDCTGKVNIEGYEIKDSNEKHHGTVNLEKAFTESCNSYFVHLGLKLGSKPLLNEAIKFKFNKPIQSVMRLKGGSFLAKNDSKHIAQQSIGQGDVLITPLHAALIAATIANDGIMVEPYMVTNIIDSNNNIVKNYKSKTKERIIDETTAEKLKNMMIEVVDKGTGKNAKIKGIKVAGKTGTAENPHGKPHSWFIGFAPANNPEIAIAVIIENGGSGSSNAAPIAAKVMKKALNSAK